FFFFQAEDGIRDRNVTGVQTCALPICWVKQFLAIGVGIILAGALPTTALAHPLGNFTVNRYSRLEVSSQQIRIRYVVDMAEIPRSEERRVGKECRSRGWRE